MAIVAAETVPVSMDKSAPASLSNALAIASVVTLLIWFLQVQWSKRRMYYYSKKVPGPPALPILGNALSLAGGASDIYNVVSGWLETYKPFGKIWLGPKLIYLISKPEHVEIILTSPHCLRKGDMYRFTEVLVGDGLFSAPVHKWKRNRKVITPTFNKKILDQYVEVFVEQVQILQENLKRQVGKGEIDLMSFVAAFTLDSICLTAMGVEVNAQLTSCSYAKWINTGMELTFQRMTQIWRHPDIIFNHTKEGKKVQEILHNIHNFTDKIVIEKRRAYEKKREELKENKVVITDDSNVRKSFLDLLIEQNYDDKKLTDEDLRAEVNTFTVAGSDSTGTTLCFTFAMMGMHPEVQQKVHEEMLDILGPDRPPTAEDMSKFKYTERVIKETMRLFPIGPFLVRTVDADIDLGDGNMLPSGSSALLGTIQTHRNADYWPEPLKFKPDRFLPEEISKTHPYSYYPFSAGPRNCIGLRYAMMKMKTAIANLSRKFVFKCGYTKVEDIKLTANLLLRPLNGFGVSVELRE